MKLETIPGRKRIETVDENVQDFVDLLVGYRSSGGQTMKWSPINPPRVRRE